MLLIINVIFLFETGPIYWYLSSTMDTDGLEFWHQGINSHNAMHPHISYYLWVKLDM